MSSKTIQINRAPVLTLWAAVVAERMGFESDEAMSLGKCLAALNAQAKGRALGIYKPHEGGVKKMRQAPRGEEFWVELCGRPIPAKNTDGGVRAVTGDKPIDAAGAERYLESKFADALPDARGAMEKLAAAFEPDDLEARPSRSTRRSVPRSRAASAAGARRARSTSTRSSGWQSRPRLFHHVGRGAPRPTCFLAARA